jgi:hypothetical protein
MMIRWAGLLILTMAAARPAHAADDGMTPAIAQCLQQNASSVETAEPDLTKATEYLVGSVCVAPIADEQRRLNQLRTKAMADRNRAQCEKRVAEQKVREASRTPNPGRSYEDCERYSEILMDAARFPMAYGAAGLRPPAAMSMAAKLILDLRLARNKSRP